MQSSLLDRIIRFSQQSDDVAALILVGSQARSANPADAFSDTDLILVVRDADLFVHSDDWLHEIGDVHISFTEHTIDGEMERRVLFDGAQDVDFVIMQEAAAIHALQAGNAELILRRGYRVLVNKTGVPVPPPASAGTTSFTPATQAEFQNAVNDFWYHTIWVTKKLLRRELWTAKFCVDSYMKWKLLWMIEQHEHIVRRSGQDTWYGGRFIERWASTDILADLQTAFAHFKPTDMAKALLQTMKLYRRLATAVAETAGFAYPAHADAYATEWVLAALKPPAKDGETP